MPKRAKQLEVPGTEAVTIEEVDTAADAYVEARDERMVAGKNEKALKDALISAMKKHQLGSYKVRGENIVVSLNETQDVKVTKMKEPKVDAGEDEVGEEH